MARCYTVYQEEQRQATDACNQGSIFYFGYLIAQYPAGYAMQKLPLGKFLAIATLSMYIPCLFFIFPLLHTC